MMDWTQAAPATLAAFLASLVECIEALTIVLAVGTVRGWRSALLGAGIGLVLLFFIVMVFGPVLGQFPIHTLKLIIGGLLLLFGLQWLRKAVLRAGGIIPLHNEEKEFAKETVLLKQNNFIRRGLDTIAVMTTFKAVVLEGLEVVFIVIAIGTAGNLLMPASLGAIAALVLVITVGTIVHRPIARIPENTLKFAVGVLLCGFGAFWTGEGMGIQWPIGDWFILVLTLGFLVAGLVAVRLLRLPGI